MNDADRHLLTIFSDALERGSPAERAAFLDGACDGNPTLRARVEALVLAHERAGPFLEADTSASVHDAEQVTIDRTEDGGSSFDAPSAEGPGTTIGRYRLLQEIGQGGMGTVFMAEQLEPVRRRVALKVIKPGMDSRQVLSRFEAERQSLAMMDHPNIARVFDAGTTEAGRPFFVMELVKGVPITEFCDQRKLTPRQRIDLFVSVCQAVQHAHQKGVIHRDLKPSNVMVALYDDRPVAKVIDFGIAKATGPKLTGQSVFTEFGAIIGTLEYMSPEQAQLNQLDVDTRSDVYSLGVLLYELLTGSTPMDLKALGEAALLDLLAIVREAEAPRPSLRLSTDEGLATIAADRGVDPRKLSGFVRGDLDWIVLKALEKDRTRRYETADALARDLRRFLDDEEVEARPPSASCRLRKFGKRHRVGLSVASAIAGVLIVATFVSTWQAVRATRAETLALESAEVERLTTAFFIDDLLGKSTLEAQVIAEIPPDPEIKVRTLVDRAAGRIEGKFEGQPLVEAAVRHMIGSVYDSLGLLDRARPHLERAEELRRRLLGEGHRDTLKTSGELGRLESKLSLNDQAEARLRKTLDLAIRHHGEESNLAIVTLGLLGGCLHSIGRVDEAHEALRRSMELARRSPSISPSQRISHQNNFAINLLSRGDEKEAEALLLESLRDALGLVGEDHPMVPTIRINLAVIHLEGGRYARAEANAREAMAASLRLYGDRHPTTLIAMGKVGRSRLALGEIDEAESIICEQLAIAKEAFGPESEPALDSLLGLSNVLFVRGRLDEAEALLLSIRGPARRLGPLTEAIVEGNLGEVYLQMSRYPEAEVALRKAEGQLLELGSVKRRYRDRIRLKLADVCSTLGHRREAFDRYQLLLADCEGRYGPEDPLTYRVLSRLATAHREIGQLDEAEALYPRVLSLGERLNGPDHADVIADRQNFAALLHVRGRFTQAETQYREAIAAYERTGGANDGELLQVRSNLGELYRDWGRPEHAEPLLALALDAQRQARGKGHPLTLWTLWKIAEMDRDLGRLDEAEANFLICLEGYARFQEPDGLDVATLRADLAITRMKQGRHDEADPLLRMALAVYDRELPDHWRRFEIQGQLGEALAAQGRHDEAEPLVLAGHEGLMARRDQVTVDAWPRLPEALQRVVAFYESWDKPEDARRWREALVGEELQHPPSSTTVVGGPAEPVTAP